MKGKDEDNSQRFDLSNQVSDGAIQKRQGKMER